MGYGFGKLSGVVDSKIFNPVSSAVSRTAGNLSNPTMQKIVGGIGVGMDKMANPTTGFGIGIGLNYIQNKAIDYSKPTTEDGQ